MKARARAYRFSAKGPIPRSSAGPQVLEMDASQASQDVAECSAKAMKNDDISEGSRELVDLSAEAGFQYTSANVTFDAS